MLQRPKIPSEALSSAFSWEARVDSWLGQTWLGRVPVKAGSVTWTTSQQVQGTLSLTVPRIGAVSQDEGARDWTPLAPDSPLATMGQVLHVQVTVASLVSTDRWDIPLGRFLITQWEVGATDIRITGKSLFQHLEDDRLTSPTVPYSGGTLASELRRLVGGHMGVIVSDALTNRPCPSMSWGESRIDAIYEIADAWPARLREGPDGVLYVLPPVPAITEHPETTLTDGDAGTGTLTGLATYGQQIPAIGTTSITRAILTAVGNGANPNTWNAVFQCATYTDAGPQPTGPQATGTITSNQTSSIDITALAAGLLAGQGIALVGTVYGGIRGQGNSMVLSLECEVES